MCYLQIISFSLNIMVYGELGATPLNVEHFGQDCSGDKRKISNTI